MTLIPVDAGQHDIEDDEIEILGLNGFQRLLPIKGGSDLIPFQLQVEFERLMKILFVFDQQDGKIFELISLLKLVLRALE